ncbi:MAG: response regulator, partial [Proteobacteria bacterium]|nr:response regulator [Pseudomonadota bacterium]
IVAVVLIETVRRVLADARMLETLGRDLAVQVERRTQERDVAQEVLTQTAHLTAVGQLAAGVGHEINNPLTVAQVNLEILCEELNGTTDSATLASEALESLRRIGRVVDDLRSAAKPTAALVDNVDARAIVRSAVQLTSHRLRHVANIKDELHEVVTIKADAVRLRQAFGNLLVNAAQALELGASGPPTIELRSRRIGPDRVAIEIVDHGVGMGPTTLARLSEPYFSTRHERGGMGLGLFVARNILVGLGGTLEFESELGRGTVARVILPIEPGAPQPQPPVEATPRDEPPRAASPLASRPRALVVDDEPMIARTIKRQLATFDVTVCSDGAEAFGVLEGDPNFDLIICDLMMPRMSGAELHAALTTTHPSYLARILFISGGAVTEHSIQFLARDDIHFVTKPFSRAELATAVEGIMTTNAAR